MGFSCCCWFSLCQPVKVGQVGSIEQQIPTVSFLVFSDAQWSCGLWKLLYVE